MSSRPSLKKGARAVADVEAGRILASVEIAAPPERVFRALASGEIAEWWGSPEEYRVTSWTGDVKRGGRWRSAGVGADGKEFAVEGEFLEVEPPRTIVQTWVAPWDGGNTTTITYKLEPIEGGTRVTLKHEGFAGRAESCRGHGEGWERVFGWLTAYLAPKDERRWFVLKLIPPRPTFPADITPEEGAIMAAHAKYCRELIARGDGLVFGPVREGAGAWGLGLVRAADEAAVRAIVDADPTVQSKRGFRFDIAPMLSAITPT